jgi:transcriptional regulator with XRE-family HTH domain
MGLSQQKLAQDIGESQSTVARIESGNRDISISELFRIAAALNVAPVELLAGSFTAPPAVPVIGKVTLPPHEAREWVKGERPLPKEDELVYFTNVPRENEVARLKSPEPYLLRMNVNALEHAVIADDVILVDQILDSIRHTVDLAQNTLANHPQVQLNPEFWAARSRRRGETPNAV